MTKVLLVCAPVAIFTTAAVVLTIFNHPGMAIPFVVFSFLTIPAIQVNSDSDKNK